ncbi:MAG: zf-HC2 domain-containing protein [Planctomycetes bacterium]|nr:zf-HC2 domain-containing protein [Planctomycetota bacterium]
MNEQHRELLSAWLDGELTAAEQAAIKDLLQRDDAKAYIAELEQTRMLVTRHAMVKAPADLATRVLARIGEGSGGAGRVAAIHQLPTANWRTPLYAIAAALLVALGIMFGPALVSPKPEAPRDVAREVIEQNNKRGGADAATEKLPGTKSDYEDADAEEMLRRATDNLKLKRDGSNGDTWGKDSDDVNEDPSKDPESLAETPKMARTAKPPSSGTANPTPPSAPADDEPRENAKTGKTEAARKVGGEEKQDGTESERAEDQNDGANARPVETTPKGRDSGKKLEGSADADATKDAKEAKHGDSATNDVDTRENRDKAGRVADKGGEDTGGSAGKAAGGGSSRGQPQGEKAAETADEQGAPPPAPQPDQAAAADADAHVLVLHATEALAAQNDVLWIASLYGAVTLKDEDAGTESVRVDLPEDKLEALLTAIRRLASDQDYTTLAVPGADAKAEKPAATDGKISGYLPGKEPERNANAQQSTVRVIVKFK